MIAKLTKEVKQQLKEWVQKQKQSSTPDEIVGKKNP